MRTPSLRRRVIQSGVAVVTLLLLVFDAFVYLTLRDRLEDTLGEVLTARTAVVRELDTVHQTDELAERLQRLGVPAIVTTAGGEVLEARPLSPRLGEAPPSQPLDNMTQPLVSQRIVLDDGATVEVFASRAGVDSTLRGVLALLVIGSAIALGAAVLLLRRAATIAMAPLTQVVAVADRTAGDRSGERLEPDDASTELGRLAVAYDGMVDRFEEALAEAQQAKEWTRRFVDDAAHQLRTPLATIRGSVEALLQEQDPRVRDRLMSNLVRETARADRLLTALLTMARLDQGRPPDLSPTDLERLCDDELDRIRSVAPHLTVVCRTPPELRRTWFLDDQGTREILANLLDNARRHARSRIEVTGRLAGSDDGGEVIELRVHDDGDGLPQGASKLVFERFATLDGQGGSGLGLPIARTLAQAQGGDLFHHDRAFVLHLPAREPIPDPAPQAGDATG
jgi:two-component system, OmpR family, sensor kinase